MNKEELEKDYYADRPTEPYCDDDSPNDWANIAHYAEENLEKAFKRIAELEAQIEKMKCCGNCIHCYEGAYHNGYRCKDHARESVCDNWEIMTDEIRKEMLEDDL